MCIIDCASAVVVPFCNFPPPALSQRLLGYVIEDGAWGEVWCIADKHFVCYDVKAYKLFLIARIFTMTALSVFADVFLKSIKALTC